MKSEKAVKAESSYARAQRRRAERIILATGCYSTAFRNEVQAALDKTPHKLPWLFQEAARINERLESAGRSIRAAMRAAGAPIREPPPKPMGRSPKNCVVREAEEIESVFVQYRNRDLNEEMSERAELISTILYDTSGEAQIDVNHPDVTRAYYVAIHDALSDLDTHEKRERVWAAFNQIRDLMNGCSDARFDEIYTIYHGEQKERLAARAIEFGDVVPADDENAAPVDEVESPELVAARQKLVELEDVPENEAVAFRLETQIYKFEHPDVDDEWADVIE